MGLREIESRLPPGFRFCPTDEELIFQYLHRKVTDGRATEWTLMQVDLHTTDPWELPQAAKLGGDETWYFFSFQDRRYSTGSRTNRSTKSGYWKATGKDRTIHEPSTQAIAGIRKTLVFYGGRAPNGVKTGWVMHEYRLENCHFMSNKKYWVLCRVFHKSKGEQDDVGPSSIDMEYSSYALPPLVDQGNGKQLPPSSSPSTGHQNGFLNLAVWRGGFLDFQQDPGCSTSTVGGGTCGDECMFLLDEEELQAPENGDDRCGTTSKE